MKVLMLCVTALLISNGYYALRYFELQVQMTLALKARGPALEEFFKQPRIDPVPSPLFDAFRKLPPERGRKL